MSYATTQFPALVFCGLYMKLHGVKGLSKHYHIWLGPKLGHEKCTIWWIPCACVACTSMLGKTWGPCVSHIQQPCYQTVVYCTYWPVLDSLNNWNIIKFANKNTFCEDFDEVHRFVLDGISENMKSLAHMVLSMHKILQQWYITFWSVSLMCKQVSTEVEQVVREAYLSSMKADDKNIGNRKKWTDCHHINPHHFHPCIDVPVIKQVTDIARNILNKKHHIKIYNDKQYLSLIQIIVI